MTFLALTRGIPERLKLKEHSIAFRKSEEMPGTLVSGVYGAHSKQMALVLAAGWSKDNRENSKGPNHCLQLDVGYRIDNFADTRQIMTSDRLESTGWLHMDRIASDLREELKDEWLEWIRSDLGGKKHQDVADKPFAEIAMTHPLYVAKMMAKRSPRLVAVVHPVNPTLDPSAVLWVATVRYDKNRFVGPVVRFLPHVNVEL